MRKSLISIVTSCSIRDILEVSIHLYFKINETLYTLAEKMQDA